MGYHVLALRASIVSTLLAATTLCLEVVIGICCINVVVPQSG